MLSSGILSRSFCTPAIGTNDLSHAIESRSFCGGVGPRTKHGTRSGALSMRLRGAGFGRVLDEQLCVSTRQPGLMSSNLTWDAASIVYASGIEMYRYRYR